jgi:hypothetical protein
VLVYPCSKARHHLWWQSLRAAGVPIVHPCWIDAEFNATGDDLDHEGWAKHWSECIQLARECELTLFLALPGEQHAGAICEIGSVLAAGRQVFAVSAVDFSFLRHPLCRIFPDLQSAIGAIVARCKGEAARAEVLNQLTPESWVCIDCGMNTAPGLQARTQLEQTLVAVMEGRVAQPAQCVDANAEIYCVNDGAWAAAGMTPRGGCLCIACLERRLGRSLQPEDFEQDHPFNKLPCTPRLLQRRARPREAA